MSNLAVVFLNKRAFLNMATRADPRGEKIFLFVLILGGAQFLEKCWWNTFKRQERGYKFFGHVSDRFSDLFLVFQTFFCID